MTRISYLVAMVALTLGIGCGGPAASGPYGSTVASMDQAPKWVHSGSGARMEGQSRVFFGVGIADGIRNEALIRQTADNRARGEIAKIFDTYIASMMKDYQRSTTAGDFSASSEEQDVVSAQKTITEVTLRGVEIRDHWMNPQSGAMYALAILDLDRMTDALNQAKALNARVRDHVRANARRAFADLDNELGKRDKRQDPPPPVEPKPADEPPPPEEKPADEPPPEEKPADEPPPPEAKKVDPANVRVGLKIRGAKASIIQTCFAGQITEAGFKLFEGTSDVDVMVSGKLTYAKAGIIRGSHMVNTWVELRVQDVANGRTIVALEDRVKIGRPTLKQSIQTSITKLCRQVTPKMVSKITGYLAK